MLGATASRSFATNDIATYTVLVQASTGIAFDPANVRVRLDFVDGNGVVRGQTSAALVTN